MTTIHPAANLFPMMGDAELKELAEDITANGLRTPLVCLGDTLIDGRNRLRACEIAGVQPTWQQLPADYTEAQILDYVVSANIHRRHLNQSQKAMVALELEPMYAAAAKERMAEAGRSAAPGKPVDKGVADLRQVSTERENKSVEQAAKVVGASGRAVSQAKAVQRDAPDLVDKVKAGDMTLDAADKERKARAATPTKPRRNREDTVVSDELIDNIVADIDAGKPHSRKDIAARYGISESTARDPIMAAKGIIKGRNETIDWDSIPGNQQDRLAKARQSIRAEIEREMKAQLQEEVNKYRQQTDAAFAAHKANLDAEYKRLYDVRNEDYRQYREVVDLQRAKGIITKAQYLTVIACLHPDNSASPEKRAEAFRIFNDDKVKLLLVKENS